MVRRRFFRLPKSPSSRRLGADFSVVEPASVSRRTAFFRAAGSVSSTLGGAAPLDSCRAPSDDVLVEDGADAFRLYEMFMGPLQDTKPWNTQGVEGVSSPTIAAGAVYVGLPDGRVVALNGWSIV